MAQSHDLWLCVLQEPMSNHIADYMKSGLVEYTYFVGRPRYLRLFRTSSQWWAYNDCIVRFAHRHKWLAFIDVDEFLVLHDTNKTSINDLMFDYAAYGGLAVNWVVFGSSGHKIRPSGGVLINYQKCLPLQQAESNQVKVIANTAHLLTMGDDPHTVFYKTPHAFTVNELGRPVKGARTDTPSHSRIGLYHYVAKSEAEYEEKMARGSAAGNHKSMDFFWAIDELATETCIKAVQLGLRCCPSVYADMSAAADQAQAAIAGVRQHSVPQLTHSTRQTLL